ncbi:MULTISPECIES: hypothetical protein [Bacillaceae]|uniref:hypothetical protein n=1 Tax=Bacillaceae TaxID=186817 RepID=UPI0007014957|nr:hypothetical protein [Bacillus sp. FJAT-25509]KQL39231.1 hypothetical protein AN960_09680 [Bacillus sp. FJAT-25509]
MERIFLMLASIIAGFALIKMPLAGTFLSSVQPLTDLIGILAILIFSLFLIYKAFMNLIGK